MLVAAGKAKPYRTVGGSGAAGRRAISQDEEQTEVWSTLLRAFGVGVRGDASETELVFARRDERTDHCVLLCEISQGCAVYLIEPEENSGDIRIAP